MTPEPSERAPHIPRRVPLFGSDAQMEPFEEDGLGHILPAGLRVTSAALDPTQLPPAAAGFLADFSKRYRDPGRYAAYGYEAMAVVLDSIDRADDPTDRKSVVDAFFATSDRGSILGTYSIDSVGNTTLPELGAYEVRGSRFVPEPEALGG